jgi:hypothetical protein
MAWVVGQSLGHAALLRRHVVGNASDLFAFVGGTGWEPPLPPILLWVLGVVTALAFAGWVVVGARSVDPTTTGAIGSVPEGCATTEPWVGHRSSPSPPATTAPGARDVPPGDGGGDDDVTGDDVGDPGARTRRDVRRG